MKRNAVIVEYLIEQVTEKTKTSKEYERLLGISAKLEQEFFEMIGHNKEIKKKYLELDMASGAAVLESEKVLCSECLRLGFMLCLDILGFSQK